MLRYVVNEKEQRKILLACHVDTRNGCVTFMPIWIIICLSIIY